MVALIPGSFDPITLGHVNIIERAAKMSDKVYVAVMNNDSAKHSSVLSSKTYLFDMETRRELACLSVAHIPNVEVISSSGMLIDLFDELSADVIIKGIRGSADLEYEMIHAKWNKEHNKRLETLFLPADESLMSVSSTRVRELLRDGKYDDLHGILAEGAIEYLKEGR
ncbi:MAG: pantetheine-phosphate adenylyltransferase [Clostridia bacterium]|nr:pantetheine-phosphate adenylyltransferase [Clostridia bacterium]